MYSLLIPQTTRSGERPLAVVHDDHKARFYQLRRSSNAGPGPLLFHTSTRWSDQEWLEANTWGTWLCTERVRDLLLEEQVAAHLLRVVLRYHTHGQTREAPRFLVVFESLQGMIDLDRSEYAYSRAGIRSLARVVLTDQAIQMQLPLFLGAPLTQLLVHDRLRARLEAAHLEGVAFAALEMVHHPWAGVELVHARQQLRLHPANASAWVHLIENLLETLHAAEALGAIEEATRRLQPPPVELSALRQQAEAALAWERAEARRPLPVPGSAR